MSDTMQRAPRLGRMVLGDDEFEKQEAIDKAGGGLLGPMVLDQVGPLVGDGGSTPAKPARVRSRKKKDPVSGAEVDGAAALAAAMANAPRDDEDVEDDGEALEDEESDDNGDDAGGESLHAPD